MVGEKTRDILVSAGREDRTTLLEPEAKTICAEYEIPIPPFKLTTTIVEAMEAASRLGFPVVLKIVSPDILHKTEARGVLLNLMNNNAVDKGYRQITENALNYDPGARIEGVLVQKMVPQGTEVIIGGIKDPQFDQIVMFGLGGVFTEILKDVTFRMAPISKDDAREMIREIKAYPLLKGYRNQRAADQESIIQILLNISRMMIENEEIGQMDLNPVMVYPKGASVVDARIILKRLR